MKWPLVLLCILLCVCKGFSGEERGPIEYSKVLSQFFELLSEINKDSSAAQLVELETFVKKHSEFASGAKWLFDKYIIAKDLKRAEFFFSNLPDSERSLQTKNWMLGQVYSRQGRSEAALDAFKIAVSVASPPPELILDFVVFDSRNLKKLDDVYFFEQLALDQNTLPVMQAFWDYINFRWKPALDHFASLPDPIGDNFTILYGWGYCLERLGDKQGAREKWQRGLQCARAIGDRQMESKFLLTLGVFAPTLEAILAYYDSSYAIANQIGELKWLEYLAGNRGILNARKGLFRLAESLLLEAIDSGRKLQSPWTMAEWYLWYGNLLVLQDRFDEALEAYDLGSELSRKAGRTDLVIGCQVREGELYRMLGLYPLAERTLREAYDETKKRDLPSLRRDAHIELAHLRLATHAYAEARRIYNTYLQEEPATRHDLEDHASWYIESGRSYFAEGDYKDAGDEFTAAYTLASGTDSRLYAALALLYLSEIDLLNDDLNGVHVRLNECTSIANETELKEVLPALYSIRADAFREAGELKKAVPQYKRAASLIERIRESLTSEASKLDYFGDKADIYDKLVNCYREIYSTTRDAAYVDSLFTYMEMKRARTLMELRAEYQSESKDSDTNFRRDKLRQATKRLQIQQRYWRDNSMYLTKMERDSVLAQIETAKLSVIAQGLRLTHDTSNHYETVKAGLPTLEKLSSTLQASHSAAIFYHFSEDPFALVITGEETKIVSLPTTIGNLDSAIQSLVNPFHEMKDDAKEVVFNAGLAYDLYKALVAPIEHVVKLPMNMIIAPDVHLANLPFEVLLTAKQERKEYTPMDDANYSDDLLIQRYAIGYVPSASFLIETKSSPTSPQVVVFADPLDELSETNGPMVASLRAGLIFSPLVFSSLEAYGIRDIYSKTSIFRREQATKEKFFHESPHYDVVHLATHAFVDPTHDVFSGLVLSTSDDHEDDGILMGYEIADMNLNADLVTLSACETGRGKVVPGEGVLGLPRLFLGAGANSVLMTHWKVNDKFAPDFMVKFYDFYLKQGLSKVNALAEAKRSVLNFPEHYAGLDYRHPLFWASFAMYGEPGFPRPVRRTPMQLAYLAATILIVLIAGFFVYYRWINRSRYSVKDSLMMFR